MKKIGMLTIGQTPRTDVIPSIKEIMGPDYDFIEAGALDGMTKKQIDLLDIRKDDYILATRLNDGSEVKVAKRAIIPLLQKQITKLETAGINLTVVMCTGRFPAFNAKHLVVTPSEILHGVLDASIKHGKLGIVYPAVEQITHMEHEFGRTGLKLYGDFYSPYDKNGPDALCERLKNEELDLIFLNCFGYDRDLTNVIKKRTGAPVIQSNAIIAKVITELV
jgi:protein AroM